MTTNDSNRCHPLAPRKHVRAKTSHIKVNELSRREYEILRSGIKAGVQMTLTAINEFRTGEVAPGLEDGAWAEIVANGMPRAL